MLKKISCKSYRYGKSHKDLHARNILVKGFDAIVIDFSKCDSGPILLDLATLDVSIAFFSASQSCNLSRARFEEWTKFVKGIYSFNRVNKVPEPKEGFEVFSRQWAGIRQIRRFALAEQTDTLEFAVCVAIELLRRSMFVENEAVGVKVASYAYFLCWKLLREILADGARTKR
jgi:hypothetical protein